MNNYERIKQMTVEEMAELLTYAPISSCDDCPYKGNCLDLYLDIDIDCPAITEAYFKNWLLQEVKDE